MEGVAAGNAQVVAAKFHWWREAGKREIVRSRRYRDGERIGQQHKKRADQEQCKECDSGFAKLAAIHPVDIRYR